MVAHMEELSKIVIDTLLEVSMELASGECERGMDAVEKTILLLELEVDNAAADGKPTKELEELNQRLIDLQTQLFRYADNR